MSDEFKKQLASFAVMIIVGVIAALRSENHSDNHFDGRGALALDLSNHTARINGIETNCAFEFGYLQAQIDNLKKEKQ